MGILKDHAGGKYLRSEDLDGVGLSMGRVLTIADFTEANVARADDAPEMKPIVHFTNDGVKPMVLNKTNLNFILGHFGDNEQKIIGKKILVWADPDVKFQGKSVLGLRLAAAIAKGEAQASPEIGTDAGGEPDDDIPF